MKSGKRFRVFALITAVVAIAAVAGVTAVTFASFSDTAPASATEVGAATVVLGRDDTAPKISFSELSPGVPAQPLYLDVTYQGSVPADVELRLESGPASPLCTQRAGRPATGFLGGILLTVGENGAPQGYCELLDGEPLMLAPDMQPGESVEVPVVVQLREGSGPSFSDVVQNDLATVTATGVGGGFSDRVTGPFDLATAPFTTEPAPGTAGARTVAVDPLAAATEIAPGVLATETIDGPVTITDPVAAPIVLPAECGRAGMRPEDFLAEIRMEPGATAADPADLFGAGVGPFVIIGTDGDDAMSGSDRGDCIVGGDGDDRITGGEASDVLVGGSGADELDGGAGDDVLIGGDGDDVLRGGTGDDALFGDLGDDQLLGDEGDDLLDGGSDLAVTCDRIGDIRASVGCPPLPVTPAPAPAPSTEAEPTTPSETPAVPPPTTSSSPPAVPTPVPPIQDPEPQGAGSEESSGAQDEVGSVGTAESQSSSLSTTPSASAVREPEEQETTAANSSTTAGPAA